MKRLNSKDDMLAWTIAEIEKIFLIILNASNNKDPDKFSKYTIQSLFIHFRALVELKEFEQNTVEKRIIKYLSDVTVHTELSLLDRNPVVKTEVDNALANFNKNTAEDLIYSLFSLSRFEQIIVVVIDKYGMSNSYKDKKVIREIYVKYLWFLAKKPLVITIAAGTVRILFDVNSQAGGTTVTWHCDDSQSTFSDSLVWK